MIGKSCSGQLESELENFHLPRFVGLRRCGSAPTLRAKRPSHPWPLPVLPGPRAAERAAASDGRRRRQPAVHLAGSAEAA
eukprot:7212138-Prymnesium_polylepis.1